MSEQWNHIRQCSFGTPEIKTGVSMGEKGILEEIGVEFAVGTRYNKDKRNGKGVDIYGDCRINSKDRKSVSRGL